MHPSQVATRIRRKRDDAQRAATARVARKKLEPLEPVTMDPTPDAILPTLAGPADLRNLTAAELDQLAAEVRQTIIATVATTGGHLGSSLGVVELTIALHRLLESPTDRIVWDTGHQAYPHKLLTGRLEGFGTLRQLGGV
ncbi:MAG TPA: 1-deoxy-D-xylulose-5-phosphate synthase N-terminal domain-containing protein, partial [Candidatus Limnocylindrales bacterium]|nr:1-deoxy-D-xylulose-5-phosphate synthase N-terminal domain-containing protein [Candidatus Limnocylindrales bacterium]